jgi:hypothetical protein
MTKTEVVTMMMNPHLYSSVYLILFIPKLLPPLLQIRCLKGASPLINSAQPHTYSSFHSIA